MCLTAECIQATNRLLSSVDPNVDPCKNFHKFACGTWEKRNVIPEDKSRYGSFSKLSDDTQISVKSLLEQKAGTNEAQSVKNARSVYKACLNETKINELGVTPLTNLISELNLFPMVNENASILTFDTESAVEKVLLSNKAVFINIYAGADKKNPSINILYVDQGGVGMPSIEYLKKGFDDKFVQAYYNYIIDVAKLLGANVSTVAADAEKIVQFEIQLANISTPREERRNATRMYNPMTIGNLTQQFTVFNWTRLIQAALPNGTQAFEDDVVVVQETEYLHRLELLLENTELKVLSDYIGWRMTKSFLWHANDELRKLRLKYNNILTGTSQEKARWRSCLKTTLKLFPQAVGKIYVDSFEASEMKKVADELVQYVKKTFNTMIENNTWMDEPSKAEALEKANSVAFHIGFPAMVNNNTALDEFFLGYGNDTTHFENYRINQMEIYNDNIKKWRTPVDKNRWEMSPAKVNAYYDSNRNAMVFPAAILQPPFFQKGQPMAMNFGAIGAVIGHEITHGFDDQGRQQDKDGKLRQWWTDATIKAFAEQAQCIIDQYSNYTIQGINLNGINTQGENIADNGGVKESFLAYNNWLLDNDDIKLPTVNYTADQLFFINYANVWCGLYRKEAVVKAVNSGVHSPGMFRINGVVSNMKQFADAFKCPIGSNMNPLKKCTVW